MVGAVIVALDVGYHPAGLAEDGRCGVVGFGSWTAAAPDVELVADVDEVAPYVSGRLFERELPCLVAGLDALRAARPSAVVECVLVDGNVRLDQHGTSGLGMYLHRRLGERIPVIGVAKTPYRGLDAVEVLRGKSTKPLFVTAAGIDEHAAASHVAAMHGPHRIPTMIRRADQLSRR